MVSLRRRTRPDVRGERQDEIEQWLVASDMPARPYLALDDEPALFEPGCRNLVICDPARGPTAKQLDQLSAHNP